MLRQKRRRMLFMPIAGALMLAGAGSGPAMAAKFLAGLNGDHVVPRGDTDGWGRVRLNVSDTFDRLCADIEVRSVGDVTAVQIHRGGPGVNGPAVVNLDRPDDGDEDDCDTIGDRLTDEILSNPGAFYVLVRTRGHPAGALRGQLIPSTD